MREGFMAAWIGGARKWNEAVSLAGTPPFISVQEAWKTFQPVGVSRVESGAVKPSEEQVGVAFENAINRFITREIGPRIQKLLLEMDQGGTARQHNSLGILYARYGMLAEAKAEFEKAAAGNYLPALNNLGNVSFLLRDFQGAVLCFEQVLSVQPENKAAIIGLARAKYELDQFTESDALFQKVQKIDPTLADRFSYLSSRLEGSAARGAAAEVRGGALWIDEEQ
jgi:tetratricopeptide (TPR) repeat protein